MDIQETSEQDKNKKVPNPTGKGGFIDNPQNINRDGRPKKEETITYWLKNYLNSINPKSQEGKKRIQELAEKLGNMAYGGNTVAMAMVLDRIDGKVPQFTDITSGGKPIENPLIISTIKPRDVISETQTEAGS